MREKVALNATTASPKTSSVLSPPTNILQPRLISSTSPSSPSTTTLVSSTPSCSANVCTTTPIDVSLNVGSLDLSSFSQVYNQITPLQPTVVDQADEPAQSTDSLSYTTLQSCPLDLSIDSLPRKRRSSTMPRAARKSFRISTEIGRYQYIIYKEILLILNLDSTDRISSTPIMAVRHVINNLFSQRSKELEKINSQSKAQRGRRLKNNTGLNITDDEFLMKMQQREQQKKPKKNNMLPKEPNITGASSSTENVIKRRGRPPKKNNANSQSTRSRIDLETEAAYDSLQSVINITNTILNHSDSDSN
jgi:hypothetical protein